VAREVVMDLAIRGNRTSEQIRDELGLHIGGVMFSEYGADIKVLSIYYL
jgi:hypothetical protein